MMYRNRGYYGAQLGFYLEHFPRGQFLILNYPYLRRDPHAFMADIFQFLDIDPDIQLDMSQTYNVFSGRTLDTVSEELQQTIRDTYQSDQKLLEEILPG